MCACLIHLDCDMQTDLKKMVILNGKIETMILTDYPPPFVDKSNMDIFHQFLVL